MSFSNLREFLERLEREGELQRVSVEVDPHLEMSALAARAVKEGKPALLFERVKGSDFPVAMNVLASPKRIELALGRHPQEVGRQLRRLMDAAMPPRLGRLWRERAALKRVLAMKPKRTSKAPSQSVELEPDLNQLPHTQSWPKDAGRFITWGLVCTTDPETQVRNVGVYRMQVYDETRTGMHWQIQKGGGFHYHKAERMNRSLELSVAIGVDPILMLAAVAPLPEGIDELAFAGFLRGKRVPMARGWRMEKLQVLAEAEFVLEGVVPLRERESEGPFGDHFGHYSHPADFPVFHVKAITHRSKPIYHAAVVGRPPQEDRFIGNAVQEMLLPMIRLIHPEIRDLWAYYETGFHSLAVISVEERYGKEGVKAALGLFGEGQMALTKCFILVDDGVQARDLRQVLRAVRDHFDPSEDFLLLPGVPFDTLDFTSLTLNLGSKMVIDATDHHTAEAPPVVAPPEDLRSFDPRIRASRSLEHALLIVQVEREGRSVVERLLARPELGSVKLVAAVSPDVDLASDEQVLWGIFTRFDPARDVIFASSELHGSWPVHRGRMGIDATFKPGYPDPITLLPETERLVEDRWNEYWK